MRLETKLIHAGEPRPRLGGALTLPVFQSSTFEYHGEQDYHAVRYIRLNNTPNQLAVCTKLAALEGAESALVAGSGMAAISASLFAVLSAGDHMLAHDCLYGGTYDFLTKDLSQLGISCTFINGDDPASWAAALRPTTRAIYVETLTNPLLQVLDLPAVVAFARAHGLVSLIDNTLATPLNYLPLSHGFDLSLHSATKYLNGHTDLVAGAVLGRQELLARIKQKLDHLGGTLDPHACFLLQRGLKTLALRVRHQNQSAQRIAEFLEGHPSVRRVNYPGLKSHPRHARARELLGGMGGLLSFELHDGVAAADRFFRRLTIPISAPSLGGVETLVTRPATTSHAGLTPAERHRQGISDDLVRVSVGLEATEDLIEDFGQALAAAGDRP